MQLVGFAVDAASTQCDLYAPLHVTLHIVVGDQAVVQPLWEVRYIADIAYANVSADLVATIDVKAVDMCSTSNTSTASTTVMKKHSDGDKADIDSEGTSRITSNSLLPHGHYAVAVNVDDASMQALRAIPPRCLHQMSVLQVTLYDANQKAEKKCIGEVQAMCQVRRPHGTMAVIDTSSSSANLTRVLLSPLE